MPDEKPHAVKRCWICGKLLNWWYYGDTTRVVTADTGKDHLAPRECSLPKPPPRPRWGQFLRAKRQEIYGKLKKADGLAFQRLVEEIRLNDEFEETVDRRGRRTVMFMERKYKEWVEGHREKL